MQVINVITAKRVKKTKKELEKDLANCKNEMAKLLVSEYKYIPTNKPTYIVEMSTEELQLVSFYLELEKRKPIMGISVDVKLEK